MVCMLTCMLLENLGRYNKGFHYMTKLLKVMVLLTLVYKAVYIVASFFEECATVVNYQCTT